MPMDFYNLYLCFIYQYSHGHIAVYLLYTTSYVTLEEVKNKQLQSQLFYCWMGDGASVEGISRRWFTRDHTKLSILVASNDDDDNTR